MSPYKRGQRAYHDGKAISANPFTYSPAWEEWRSGYMAAWESDAGMWSRV